MLTGFPFKINLFVILTGEALPKNKSI